MFPRRRDNSDGSLRSASNQLGNFTAGFTLNKTYRHGHVYLNHGARLSPPRLPRTAAPASRPG
jgi:hypothetical protein